MKRLHLAAFGILACAATTAAQREIGYADDPNGCDYYYGRSLAIGGNTLAVGRGDVFGVGEVLVYERSGGQWLPQQTIVPFALQNMQQDRVVALRGGRLFVSANFTGLLVHGLVTVWERNGNGWVSAGTFGPLRPGGSGNPFPDRFAADGNLAVGSTYDTGDPAFVFGYVDPLTGWVEVAQLQDAQTPWVRVLDVAMSGTRIAVLATVPQGCPLCETALYVFDRDPTGAWVQAARLPSIAYAGEIALDQDRVAWLEVRFTGLTTQPAYALTIGDRDPATGVWTTTPLGFVPRSRLALTGDLLLLADNPSSSLDVPNGLRLFRHTSAGWTREDWSERDGFGRIVATDGALAAVMSGPWGPFGQPCLFPGRINVYDLARPAAPSAEATPAGGGCSGGPTLISNPPVLGTTAFASSSPWPPTTLAFCCLGLSNTVAGSAPLPLLLDPLGINGCSLGQDCAITLTAPATVGGATVSFELELPLDLALVGVHVYQQLWGLTAGVNPAGVWLSDTVDLRLGAHR
ncbi:MAG: hypothetical protein AB7O97_03325 [Planctomycetota bacterium]